MHSLGEDTTEPVKMPLLMGSCIRSYMGLYTAWLIGANCQSREHQIYSCFMQLDMAQLACVSIRVLPKQTWISRQI